MNKTDEAIEILRALGLPRAQQNERSALTLLALANLGPNDAWAETGRPRLRIWDIMAFMREQYGKNYAANSRETIRRQTIHQFEQARLVDRNPDDPCRPTNSGKNCYMLTAAAFSVLKTYGTADFEKAVDRFIRRFGQLEKAYIRTRDLQKLSLRMPDGATVHLSPGRHNALQVAVIEGFGPRFVPGGTVLYIGDTAKKQLVCAIDHLSDLGVRVTEHDKLPDIILYDPEKKWLFLVEAVTSHGPVSPKRHAEIERMLTHCKVERIYVTAFLTRAEFRRCADQIAWETEVWIAECADHMIHFNGPKFLGPYGRDENRAPESARRSRPSQ